MTGNDLYRLIAKVKEPSPWVGRFAQLAIVASGLILIHYSNQTLVYLGALAGALGMQSLPALMGALFWPMFNRVGVFSGMVFGVITTVLTELVWTHPFGIHSGFWGTTVNFLVVITVSLLSREKISQESIDGFHNHLRDIYKGEKSYRKAG